MPTTTLIQQKITLDVSDGTRMDAYVARPDDDNSHPATFVLQEAFGVNRHIRNVTDRLAREGYVAIAPELFHRTAAGFEGDYDNFSAVLPHTSAMKPDGVVADLNAGFQWLRSQKNVSQDRVFAVGYCMGGRIAFAANALLPLRAAVSLLWRRHRAWIARSGPLSARSYAVFLGRARPPYSTGTARGRDCRDESQQQSLHQCRILRCRPRFFLR